MELRRRAGPQTATAFVEEATAALRAMAGHEAPVLLAYHPTFRTNPYLRLLYQRARDHGVAPVGMQRHSTLPALTDLQRAGLPTALHLHWLHLVLSHATAEGEAQALADAFLGDLDAYRAAGGRIAWTIHNILPHETRWEAAEIRLAAGVADRAAMIHVLAASTPELVAPYYRLAPDRVVHVPHPSYAGAYEDHVTRLDARHELGMPDDAFVYLALGGIRPYKGLDRLLEAWRALPPDPTRRLVVAGDPIDEPGVAALIEALVVEPTVLVDARRIPPEEMQLFLRAADVGVLPHRRVLNSGALLLYLTFGLPVVLPAGSGLAELADPAFATAFDADRPGSLEAALEAARSAATPAARAAALETAGRFDPGELSDRFARELRGRLLAPSAA